MTSTPDQPCALILYCVSICYISGSTYRGKKRKERKKKDGKRKSDNEWVVFLR